MCGWRQALQPNPDEGIRERKHQTVEPLQNLNPPLLATQQEYVSHLLKKRGQSSDGTSSKKHVTYVTIYKL